MSMKHGTQLNDDEYEAMLAVAVKEAEKLLRRRAFCWGLDWNDYNEIYARVGEKIWRYMRDEILLDTVWRLRWIALTAIHARNEWFKEKHAGTIDPCCRNGRRCEKGLPCEKDGECEKTKSSASARAADVLGRMACLKHARQTHTLDFEPLYQMFAESVDGLQDGVAAVILHFGFDYSWRETAVLVGGPESVVRLHCWKALYILAERNPELRRILQDLL